MAHVVIELENSAIVASTHESVDTHTQYSCFTIKVKLLSVFKRRLKINENGIFTGGQAENIPQVKTSSKQIQKAEKYSRQNGNSTLNNEHRLNKKFENKPRD